MKWICDGNQQTWEPECNVPKTMLEEFEKGVQEPTVFCQEIDKKFGVTTMTSVKVKTRDERPLKRRKVCDVVDENR